MKKLIILLLLSNITVLSAQEPAYGDGEWFKFRIHYGLITAGYATLEVDEKTFQGKQVHHVKGYGKTVGVSRFFFKVEDDYQTYIDKDKDIPYRFIRKIDEGGHTKDIQIDFDHESKEALVFNKKHATKEIFAFPENTQDKEKESLTVWVTDDKNKMPILVKADLAVGSLKATLTEYKGLKHSFKIIAD